MDLRRIAIVFRQLNRVIIGRLSVMAEKVVRRDEKYLAFQRSSRDLVQMMAERSIALAHTTILRWVQRYVPDFEKRSNQYARAVGDSWRVDET